MRGLLLLVGLIAIVLGVYWVVEGMKYVNYVVPYIPSHYGEQTWAYYGGGMAVVGLIVALYSRRS
ncbi:MAG TPA: hypothetical protein VMH86_17200 [Rhizomicrobium sp.]|nr:hypothetical protein [Rhizomicrobium sp.]